MGLANGREMGRSTLLWVMMILFLVTNFTAIAGDVPRRHLLQTSNASDQISYSDDTVRVDPLDSFKKYRGGYNLTNKHYWSSTIFTGVYGYAIGVSWLLFGILFGGFIALTSLCGHSSNKKSSSKLQDRKSYCHQRHCHLWLVLVACIFTVLAIVAVGLVLGGNAKFHSRANTVVDIIMDTANEATETIHNTTGAMRQIKAALETSKGTTEISVTASADSASGFLGSTSQRLDSEAADIERQASKNRRLIDKGLKIVYIITSVTISINLVAVIALSVTGFLKLRQPLYWLITLCWLLTFMCWLLFGMYFFLDKFSSDTCTALDNFQRNPNNNSLSTILPCDELLSAKSVLSDVSAGIYDLVNEVNANISLLQGTPNQNFFSVCNPFSAPPSLDYQPDNCPPNTIRIADIPKVLKSFTCSDANAENCSANGEFISTSDYNKVEAYTSSIQTLLNAYPGMESLIECQSVKDAFSEILLTHCGPLKRYVHMVWSALAFLAVVMVFLVILWSRRAMHEQKHHVADCSVKPHSVSVNNNPETESMRRDII
ncbi:uncharacterized protein LOC116194384 [Punica granatum]|uniref:Uncharacterized protein n=2 Tax=Punica granatum TaxID=22663 RepID=A0A218W4X9_PUNGR|nr:uncharacterized protein LOC116194384 [Punica granatum]XP_031379057.1 uncharacterized protein LOC116194384 [Punica granatum]OWM67907.1 hypothetical protein CDL15_Pgr010845 [Punica granatum]PKI63814.1 hypothetical protein CRG98_015798 [Punica granatum]